MLHHSKETWGIPKYFGVSAWTIKPYQINSLRSVKSKVTKTNKVQQGRERTTLQPPLKVTAGSRPGELVK